MSNGARRVAMTCVLGTALFGGGTMAAPVAAQACDPSYPEVCLAAYLDLDCADIGYAVSVVHDPSIEAYDPHDLDADFDGIGCETW
jgi:hypothetical protein